MSLYETLKAAKIGAAPDVFTTLRAQIAPFAKGSNIPTEKELEDIPPLSFAANGDPLIDWNIDGTSGGVGDKTAQLFNMSTDIKPFYLNSANGVYTSTGSTSRLALIKVKADTQYTITAFCRTFRVSFFSCEPANGSTPSQFNVYDYTEYESHSKTLTSPNDAKYMAFFCYNSATEAQTYTENEIFGTVMINEGSTAVAYEPYGYKIPVTCGGETKTIYLDEPLGSTDSISMTDTGISIPTADGSNTLSIGTTVQPSSVYIKYKE